MVFDGTPRFVQVPFHTDLVPEDHMTVEAWFVHHGKPRARIVNVGDGWGVPSNRAYEIESGNPGASFFVGPANSSGRWVPVYPKLTVPQGTWVHMAATFDAKRREARLYMNGALELNLLGGTMLVATPIVFPVVVDSQGMSLSLPLPNDATLDGVPLFLQAALQEPTSPAWAWSPGLQLMLGLR